MCLTILIDIINQYISSFVIVSKGNHYVIRSALDHKNIWIAIIHEIGGGLRGLRDPPKTQKSQKATPPETPLKSSGIATTLKPNSNPPKNFRDRPS